MDFSYSNEGTTAVCILGRISGVVFSPPGGTVTCNYTAVQITAKASIRKHRKAVTECVTVRYSLSQNFKIVKKILN